MVKKVCPEPPCLFFSGIDHCIWSFEGTSYDNFLVISFQRYHFSLIIRASYNIWKKDFCPKFSFLNEFTQTPTPSPLSDQNPLSVTKVCCWCNTFCWIFPFWRCSLAAGSVVYVNTIHNSGRFLGGNPSWVLGTWVLGHPLSKF